MMNFITAGSIIEFGGKTMLKIDATSRAEAAPDEAWY
jgi:hypothetical protein